jgi:general secretion pathway protein J
MNGSRGFSLLELLIGLTLLGFILTLLFGGFRLASKSWDSISEISESTADAQSGRALLRRILVQIRPMRWKRAINQPITFEGDRSVLRAIAPVSGRPGSGGLRVVELSIEAGDSNDGPLRLVLRDAPVHYDGERFSEGLGDAGEGHVILSHLDAVEFSYFGPEKRDDPPRWQTQWNNLEQLPQLIRIQVAEKLPGWTDVIVAPMVTANTCRWNSFYQRCL